MAVQPTSSVFAGSAGASSSTTTASSSGGGTLQAIPPEGDADYTQLLSDLASNQAARAAADSLLVPDSDGYKLSYDYQVMKRLYAQTASPENLDKLGQALDALTVWITASFPAGSQTLAQRALGVEPLRVQLAPSRSVGAPPPVGVTAPIDVSQLTDTQLRELTVQQAKVLSSSDLQLLGDRVNLLSQGVLSSLLPTQISGVKLSALSLDQLWYFTPNQLTGLQEAQITELIGDFTGPVPPGAADKLQTLLGDDIAQLPPSVIPVLKLRCLNPSQLGGLTKEQMEQVTAPQMNALEASRWPELGAGVTGLQSSILGYLDADKVSGLSVAQVKLFGAELANFHPDALKTLLSSADKVAALSNAALSALIAHRKSLLVTANGTAPTILQRVPPATIAGLSPDDFAALGLLPLTDAQCQQLLPGQLAKLTASDATNVPSERLTALSASVFHLPPAFLGALSVAQVSGWRNEQTIRNLDTKVASLSPAVLNNWFTVAPFVHEHITTAGISALMVVRSDLYVNSPGGTGKQALTAIDTVKVGLLSPLAINAVGLNAFSEQQRKNLNPGQFALLTYETARDKISAQSLSDVGLKLAGFPPSALGGLPVNIAAGLSEDQMGALDGKIADLSRGALSLLLATRDKAQAVTGAGLSALIEKHRTLLVNQDGSGTAILGNVALNSIYNMSGNVLRSLGLKALTDTQFYWLSNAQLAALTRADVVSQSPPPQMLLSPNRIAGLLNRVSNFSEDVIGGLTREQAAAFTPTQITELRLKAAKFSDVVLTEVILNDVGKLRAFTPDAMAFLVKNRLPVLYAPNASPSRNYLPQFTDAQIAILTADHFSTLGNGAASLARVRVSTNGSTRIESLNFTEAQIPGVKLSSLDNSHLRAMTPAQVSVVLPEQITAMSGPQVAQWDTKILSLSDAALKALSDRHASNVTQTQIDALFDAGKFPILNQEFVNGLGSKLPQDLSTGDPLKMALSWLGDPSKLTDSQIKKLTAEDIAGWSAEQIAALGTRVQLVPVSVLEELRPAQLARVQLRNMSNLQLIALTAAQLSGLTQPTQVEGMTTRQLEKLGADILSLPDAVIAGIDLMMLNRLSLIRLANAKAGVFTVAQVGALTADRFRVIGNVIANLSNRALEALTGDQVRTLFPYQVQALDGKLGLLTPEAFGDICKDPRRVRNITVRGAESLRPDHLAVAPLHWFSLEALSVLTPAQLAEVTPAQLEKLSPQQRAALPPGTFD